MFLHLALVTLILPVNLLAQHPKKNKPRKKPTVTATVPKAPSTKDLAPDGFTLVRSAGCVLLLKGQMIRKVSMSGAQVQAPNQIQKGRTGAEKKIAPAPTPRSVYGQTMEHFEYGLPGTLTEEVDPKGTRVRFRFTPVKDINAAMIQARLHLEDQSKGPGDPPTVIDASEVLGVDPFVFEAAARGQQLVPVSGLVVLKGRIQNATTTVAPNSMVAPVGPPVVSLPLPPLSRTDGVANRPGLLFQGVSLWAWPNTPGPFTVTSTVVYDIKSDRGAIAGTVDVTFQVGATR